MGKRRQQTQQEELYVISRPDKKSFMVGPDRLEVIPWHQLGGCHLYAVDEEVLTALLLDAAIHGHQVRDGSISDRRGMGGFEVCIGPHGRRGVVACRRLDSWAIEVEDVDGIPKDPLVQPAFIQEKLRDLCDRLNEEEVGFRPTAIGLLRALYERYGRPLEPSEAFPPPLFEDAAKLCRRAHVGGPVLHVRTSLSPYVRLDRQRAYGEAMTGDMPSGTPVLTEDAMQKWTAHKLMRMCGVADATVLVEDGPVVPLLPVLRWNAAFDRSRALHPTGTFRGAFVLEELAFLEESGRGRVLDLHKVYVFERCRSLAPVIRWLRKLEPDLQHLVLAKRLEHVLYGTQSRSLTFRRFASVPSYREPVLQDILDSRTLERVRSRAAMFRMPVKSDPMLPIYEIRGTYSMTAPHGTLDRPDRSAHVTARNRIEVCRMLLRLDKMLGSKRSGEYVGRVHVDGIDIEGDRKTIGPLPDGWQIREEGKRLDIHRSNVTVSTAYDGSVQIEDGGLCRGEAPSHKRLMQVLEFTADPDGGPLASGRYWPHVEGHEDPRLLLDQRSEPIDFAPGAFDGLSFSEG